MNDFSVTNEKKSIVLSHISKSFNGHPVLGDLSFSVPYGSTLCIMGASGCGKTTLLNIIMGIEKPEEGTVTGVPGRIAAVFQEDRLCEDFRCITNIRMASEKTDEEILACLDSLLIGDSAYKKISELSGGMKRRAAIARALLSDHDLLVMDEPFKGLDPETRKKTASLIRETSCTKIIVTHDEEDAELLGASVIRLS